jgi:hypothetical protein
MDMDVIDVRERAHRVAVHEPPPPAAGAPDYADAFAVARRPGDDRSAEAWARGGFDRIPPLTREAGLLTHRIALGFRLGPWASPEHVFGWRIVSSEPEVLHLRARSGWLRGDMVWRLGEARLVMTTFVGYEMPRVGSLVWGAIGNVHRACAPYLLALAATAPEAAA